MHPSLPLPLRKVVIPRTAILSPIPIQACPKVSIIVPARNEEASLGDCLRSLATQSGTTYEIIVVDDGSTDLTRAIAESCSKVRVISSGLLPAGWTGKNNAVTAGATIARGDWLLFTDADTVHRPGSLARALAEAKEYGVDMLSYSPEQIAVTFWEMAVLPVVFAELASQYPPTEVSDPASPIAAANGQYILIRRKAYEAVGGHRAIASDLLEDVALARAVKRSGRKIRFRHAADAVRTRMYRNWAQLREGWTKNLALLFPKPGWLAAKTAALWIVMVAIILARPTMVKHVPWMLGIQALSFLFLAMRLRRANFGWDRDVLGAGIGYPVFAYLLPRSKRAHARNSVQWKGRTYSDNGPERMRDETGLTARTSPRCC